MRIMTKNYINLTNGIEAIPLLKGDYSFIRIQSTACEQHLWDKILQELDYDFLMNVALGNECIIYDYGTRKPKPRAIYQGVEFIKFVLYKFWYGETIQCFIARGNKGYKHNSTDYFLEVYNDLSEQTFNKLRYFTPFLGGKIDIKCVTNSTIHDNDKEFYARILMEITGNGN